MIQPPYDWKETFRMVGRRFGPTPPRRNGPLDGTLTLRDAPTDGWVGFVGDLGPTFGKRVHVSEKVRTFFDGCEALAGNLEGVLTDRWWRPYRQPIGDAVFGLLETLGPLDGWVLSLANNHALDYGPDALDESVRRCEERSVRWCGLADRPRVRWTDDVTLTAWTWWLNGPDETRVVRTDPRCPDEPGLHVAFPHWGYEHERRPRDRQRRRLPDGYDAVVGHHSHLPQPVERIDGERLVAWSLGNFVTGKYLSKLGEGLVLKLGIHRPESGGAVFTEAEFRHLRIERPYRRAECRIDFLV